MTNSFSLPSFIVRRMIFSSWTLYNTSSVLTRSVQLTFSIFLQQRTLKLRTYYFPRCPVWAPYTAVLKMQHFINFFLKPDLLVNSLLPECSICHGNPLFKFACTSCIVCYHATQTVEILHIIRLFLLVLGMAALRFSSPSLFSLHFDSILSSNFSKSFKHAL